MNLTSKYVGMHNYYATNFFFKFIISNMSIAGHGSSLIERGLAILHHAGYVTDGGLHIPLITLW